MSIQSRTASFQLAPSVFRILGARKRPQRQRHQRRSGLDVQAQMPGVVGIGDLVLIIGLGLAANHLSPGRVGSIPSIDLLEIVLGAIVFINYLALGRAYRFKALRNERTQVISVSSAWLFTVISLCAFGWLTEIAGELVGRWAMIWYFGVWLMLLGWRAAIRRSIDHHRARGDWRVRVAVAGDGTPAFGLVRHLQSSSEDLEILGIFVAGSCPLQGQKTIDDLYDLANAQAVDEILIALPWPSRGEFNATLHKLCTFPVDVKLYTGMPGPVLQHSIASDELVAALPIQRRPLLGWGAPLKRAEDLILGTILLCVLAPFLLVIAALIKIDSPGPILFLQERFGFNNNSIRVCKFRTMYHDPNGDPMVRQARRNDPRVTRVGALLRRTSLDELPQLFNVLGGSMSLIGPRPHATVHNKKYGRLIDGYLGRHRMKPGISGWAQVNGHRGETDTIEKMRLRLQHDLHYIDNWSLFFDLRVLVMTVPALIHAKNAY